MAPASIATPASPAPSPSASRTVRAFEEDVVMPTYRLGPPDPNPMFYTHESYQGAQKHVYPYALQDAVTFDRQDRPHRFAVLENEFVRISVLPEWGGRLFSAVDKTNGYPYVYGQHVIKPALIGMTGAWISGGIEWCVFHHHRQTSALPVDYRLVNHPNGSSTIYIGETEHRHRMRWVIAMTLHPGRSDLEVEVKMINRTDLPHAMLYWANVATHANDSYEIVFPPSVRVATHHSKIEFAHWPIAKGEYQGVDYRGVDLRWWKNHPEPVSFFAWDLKEDFSGGYDHGKNAGLVHVADHHIVNGAKLWEWGPGPRGRMWDEILTDTDGPYAELMVGAYSDNQPDYSFIAPGEVRAFRQYWYPVRDIGGFDHATREVAVNLDLTGAPDAPVAKVGVYATRVHESLRVELKRRGQVLFTKVGPAGPAEAILADIAVPRGVTVEELELAVTDEAGVRLATYAPKRWPDPDKLPDPVRPPAPPKAHRTVESLVTTGRAMEQVGSPSVDPTAYYAEALAREPENAAAHLAFGTHLLRRFEFAKAREHFARAEARQTQRYIRPKDQEAAFLRGVAAREQGLLDEAYDAFRRAAWDRAYRSAAMTAAAEISVRRGDLRTAETEVSQALETNASSTRALTLRASILRRLGRTAEGIRSAQRAAEVDPLDPRAAYELELLGVVPKDAQGSSRSLMRGEVQAYLELATDYARAGLYAEAVDVLSEPGRLGLAVASQSPIVDYHAALYEEKRGREARARELRARAKGLPHAYVFPHRHETIEAIEAAVSRDPSDAKAHYYLGNVLYEVKPEPAIAAWEKARALDPTLAIVHRNLGFAYYRIRNDLTAAIASYERAVQNVSDGAVDPRHLLELDRLYEAANTPPEVRFARLSQHHAVVVAHGPAFEREIETLVLTGRHDEAIRHLTEHRFHVFEGGGKIHATYVDARLLRGLARLEAGRGADALADFEAAALYPANLSVGKPKVSPREAEVDYHVGLGLLAVGREADARARFEAAASKTHSAWTTRFYRALSLRKLGKEAEAKRGLTELKNEGQALLKSPVVVDVFAKFGEQATAEKKRAEGHFLLGLAQWGRGDRVGAKMSFERAVAGDRSHVWAAHYLHAARGPGFSPR